MSISLSVLSELQKQDLHPDYQLNDLLSSGKWSARLGNGTFKGKNVTYYAHSGRFSVMPLSIRISNVISTFESMAKSLEVRSPYKKPTFISIMPNGTLKIIEGGFHKLSIATLSPKELDTIVSLMALQGGPKDRERITQSYKKIGAKISSDNARMSALPTHLKEKIAGYLKTDKFDEYLENNPDIQETQGLIRQRLTATNPHTGEIRAISSSNLGLTLDKRFNLACLGKIEYLDFEDTVYLVDFYQNLLVTEFPNIKSLKLHALDEKFFKQIKFNSLTEFKILHLPHEITDQDIKNFVVACPRLKTLAMGLASDLTHINLIKDLSGLKELTSLSVKNVYDFTGLSTHFPQLETLEIEDSFSGNNLIDLSHHGIKHLSLKTSRSISPNYTTKFPKLETLLCNGGFKHLICDGKIKSITPFDLNAMKKNIFRSF